MEVDKFSSALIPRDIPLDRHTNSPWKPLKREEMETLFNSVSILQKGLYMNHIM